MRRWIVALVVWAGVLALSMPAMAQGRPAGWGIGLGSGTAITGVSLKNQMGERALQAVIGCWGGYRNNCYGLGASVDLLINMPLITEDDTVQLAWNLGGGGAIGLRSGGWARHPHGDWRGDSLWLGGQFVAGLEFIFPKVPLDVVLEWRPTLFVIPTARLWIEHAGFHVRYYFQ